jgi:hypothetical protein
MDIRCKIGVVFLIRCKGDATEKRKDINIDVVEGNCYWETDGKCKIGVVFLTRCKITATEKRKMHVLDQTMNSSAKRERK